MCVHTSISHFARRSRAMQAPAAPARISHFRKIRSEALSSTDLSAASLDMDTLLNVSVHDLRVGDSAGA